jgi:hypothetical protein
LTDFKYKEEKKEEIINIPVKDEIKKDLKKEETNS